MPILLLAFGMIGLPVAADPDDYAVQLQTLTPDYAAPPLVVLDEPGDTSFAVTLVGISLEQKGERLLGNVPIVTSDAPLKVTTYWRARVRMVSRVATQVSFWDHLSVIRETIDLRVGPAHNAPPWEVGGVYAVEHDIDMRPVTRQFSGHASIVVAVQGAASKSNRMRPRQLLRVVVTPSVRESGVLEDDIAAAFGAERRFIAKHLRLGNGARTELPVPEEWRTGNRRVAIVSSMSYKVLEQGATVCDIILNPGTDSELRLSLVAGENTALCNYDALPPGSANHDKVSVFASRDSGQVGDQGTPLQLHTYLAFFDLPSDIESIDAIAFECNAAVILDIDGVALLP